MTASVRFGCVALVHLTTAGTGDGHIGVVRPKPAVDDAIAALGLPSLELVTAPLLRSGAGSGARDRSADRGLDR